MNNTKGYEIKLAAKEIIVTKKFEKAAGVYGTDEYKVLIALKNDFSDFSFRVKTIEKKENKVAYKGLSIEEMKRFIKANRSQEEQELFEKILELQNGNKGKYAAIKKWFLNRYKEVYTTALEELTEVA